MSSAVFDSLSSTAASSQLLVPYKDTDTPSTTGESPAENLKSDYNNDPRPSTRLKIKRHSPKARIPTGGSAQASGYDLYRLDTSVFNHSRDLGLMDDPVQKRKLFQQRGELSLIPSFQLDFLMGHMDALPHGVALVGTTQESFHPTLTHR